MRNEGKNQSY